ncbi:Sen15 domain-containing protein [Pseudozyma hubeiensis]|nr:Sen15 domain-containing protein [Pseudozyma hubeiensis]
MSVTTRRPAQMAFTSTRQATDSDVREALAPSLPGASSHQLSKRQQYDALIDAEAGPSSSTVLQASPASHPSFPAVAPLCRRYPSQASALFQTYLDLKNGAAAWDIVEPLALSTGNDYAEEEDGATKDLGSLSDAEAEALIRERMQSFKTGTTKLGLVDESDDGQELLRVGLAAIKGRRKDAKAYEIVIPLTISQHLQPAQLKAIFTLINLHAASCPPGEDVDTSHVLLAIIAQDSTLVYYLISQGMVKPIN